NVKWTMTNHPNFMGKAMGMFMNMETMVGPDFEKGLASMKTVAEAEAKKQADAKKTAEAPPPEAQPAPQ
ncbi:MAG TPA: polyketide cyclase, partial [Planctomycetota bacterium]|nr:polyketide cyclase [Planctomycetota bacterium]